MTLKPTLYVLVPVPITQAMVASSTILENEYEEWKKDKSYAVGDRVVSKTTHRIYESAAAANAGHDPTDPVSLAGSTVWWVDKGPTNYWALFDDQVSTQTVCEGSFTVVLRPGVFNAVYLAGVDATSLTITVKDAPGGEVIFSITNRLEASQPDDYWDFYFSRFRPLTNFLVESIDQYAAAELTVTISRPSGKVKVGVLAVGDLKPLGATQYGAKAKPKSYSRIKTDDFGNTSITRRKKATDMSATAWISRSEGQDVLQTLQEVMDVPCAWISPDVRTFGLGNGEVSFDYPEDCLLTLNVEGMI